MPYLEAIREQHGSVLLDFTRSTGMRFYGPESTDSEPPNYMYFQSDIAGNVQRKIYLGADREGLYAFGYLVTIETETRGNKTVEVRRHEENISLEGHKYSHDSRDLISENELRALLNRAYDTMMSTKPKKITENVSV